jgi:hypothetical protein
MLGGAARAGNRGGTSGRRLLSSERRCYGRLAKRETGRIVDGHSRHRCRRPADQYRAPRPAAPRGDRQHRRHDDRMVRLSGLWPDGGAGLRQIVFSQIRPADRHLGGVRGLCDRLCRTADRGGDLRTLRRPHRPQGSADRHPAADRFVDLSRRMRPDLRADRHMGCGPAGRAALHSGDRGRRRVGRLGPVVDGMGAHQQKPRADRLVAAILAGRPASSSPTSRSWRSAGCRETSSSPGGGGSRSG